MTGVQTEARARDRAGIPRDARVIDVDAHVHLPGIEALLPYLSTYWCESIELAGHSYFYRPYEMCYPPQMPTSRRPGWTITEATTTADGLDRLRAELLGQWDLAHAVVNVTHFVDMLHNPYLAEALARALNDWLVAEWLEPEARLRGSLVVSAEQPAAAVREIERYGGHPSIVQVLLPAQSSRPYGNPIYRPIFEAAAAYDLVIGLHYGGWPGQAPTAVGWPSHYIEQWTARSQHAQTQVMSIVSEGVFSSVPQARVAVLECGWARVPAFLWRFDKDWKGLRRETPWVQRLPSEYVREHIRFSLQPVDGPARPEHLARVLDQIDGTETLMFSTDYPHWTFEDDADAIPRQLLAGTPGAVLSETANAFYRLDQKG